MSISLERAVTAMGIPAWSSRWFVRFLGLAIVACIAAAEFRTSVAVAAPSPKVIEAADKLLPMLEQQCAGAPDDYEYVKNCKKLVRQIMDVGVNDEDSAYISRRFAEQLCKSDEFRTHDYYLLWLGNRLLVQFPADNAKLIDALRKKVNNRDRFAASGEIRQELCAFAIETILNMVAYPGKTPIESEMRIDWQGWDSLSAWIEKNHDQFVFDKGAKRFQPKKP